MPVGSRSMIRGMTVTIGEPDAEWAWEFELGFLRSHYRCIFGEGCPSLRNNGASDGCCQIGVHVVDRVSDVDELEDVVERVERLTDEDWENRRIVTRRGGGLDAWATRRAKGEVRTRTWRGACIFHNRPEHSAGAGCAFHIAALRRGESPLDWKPFTCWTAPLFLEFDEDRRVCVVRAARQRDWNTTLDWWCIEQPVAYTGSEPVYRSLEPELRRLVGDAVYEELRAHLERTPNELPTDQPVDSIGLVPLPMRRGG